MAIVRWAIFTVALLRNAAAVAARRKVEESMVWLVNLYYHQHKDKVVVKLQVVRGRREQDELADVIE
jgi:tmRNA-binding protein